MIIYAGFVYEQHPNCTVLYNEHLLSISEINYVYSETLVVRYRGVQYVHTASFSLY